MRIPGFEPEQQAWEACIITTRSYPQNSRGLNIMFIFKLCYDRNITDIKKQS